MADFQTNSATLSGQKQTTTTTTTTNYWYLSCWKYLFRYKKLTTRRQSELKETSGWAKRKTSIRFVSNWKKKEYRIESWLVKGSPSICLALVYIPVLTKYYYNADSVEHLCMIRKKNEKELLVYCSLLLMFLLWMCVCVFFLLLFFPYPRPWPLVVEFPDYICFDRLGIFIELEVKSTPIYWIK